jgi:acetolactate synthase-1/2/3 large subunit
VYAPSAVDVYPSSLSLSVGCVSSLGGSREANFAVQNADLLLILGCRMPSMLTGGEYDKFAHSAKKILVDTDECEPKKGNIVYDKIVSADVKLVLAELNKKCIKRTPLEWVKKCTHWKDLLSLRSAEYAHDNPVDLYNLAGKISKYLPDDAVLITDAGFEELIIPSNTVFREKQRCIHPFMQGSMGFALPAVVGASIAKTDCQVVAVIGDGSIMMNLQEFQTISNCKIPAKIIVVNNNMYAVIRKRQKDLFRTRLIGTDTSNGVNSPDWEKVADCFGLKYMKIINNGELSEKLSKLFSMNCTVICEIVAVEEQPYLHTSFARNEQGVFERRPMEDQAPFLDREIFNAEMIQDNKCVEN